MIIQRLFSKKKEKGDNNKDAILGGAGLVGGGAILSKTKTSRLTGKVTRYHDAPVEVIDKIKEEGLKAKYSTDPNNLTNTVLKDIPMDKKEGLVYTHKKRNGAFDIGTQRSNLRGELSGEDILKENITKRSPRHKVLKLEFEYDDIKNQKRIENPELRGTKTPKEFYNKIKGVFSPDYDDLDPFSKSQIKKGYKSLGEETHIFKGDIDPSHIVGGKGYKKRGIKNVIKYIKNNPKRFGKEAAKVGTGIGIAAYGGKKLIDHYKKDNKD